MAAEDTVRIHRPIFLHDVFRLITKHNSFLRITKKKKKKTPVNSKLDMHTDYRFCISLVYGAS